MITGIPFYLNEPRMALDFLVKKLGFAVHRHTVSKNPGGVMVGDNYGNFYEIFLHTRKHVNDQNDFTVVINTNDCLNDFHHMDPDGLSIIKKPHYVPEGLAFEILDPWGNKYTFLERRDYTD